MGSDSTKLPSLQSELFALRGSEETSVLISLKTTPRPYQRVRLGKWGAYNPNSYTKYKNEVKSLLKLSYLDPPRSGALGLKALFFLKGKAKNLATKRPDLDNLLKSVLDCGNGILWNDDSQIVEVTTQKRIGEPQILLWMYDVTENEKTRSSSGKPQSK